MVSNCQGLRLSELRNVIIRFDVLLHKDNHECLAKVGELQREAGQ